MERSSARSACGVVTLRSADCQVEDKARKIITSWQKSVIRKERPWLRWLSTPPPAMYPSPFGWCSLEISTEQPPLELSLYKETLGRRQKVNSLFWLKLRKAQPAAHSGGEGPVSPGIPHQNQCPALGSFAVSEVMVVSYLCFHLYQAPSLLPRNKIQSLWQRLFSCDQQQLCISTDRSRVIFLKKLPPLSLWLR